MKALHRRRSQVAIGRSAKRIRERGPETAVDPGAAVRELGDHIDRRHARSSEPSNSDVESSDAEGERHRLAWERNGMALRSIAVSAVASHEVDAQNRVKIGHQRSSVTCVSAMDGCIIYGDKNGVVIRVTSSSGVYDRQALSPAHVGAVLCVALSDTRSGDAADNDGSYNRSTMARSVRSYIVSGGADAVIHVWSHLDEIQHVGTLRGHRGPVTGLAFRLNTATSLVSCSADSTVRVWSVPDLSKTDTLYGHHGAICAVGAAVRDRAVSGGMDGSLRVWRCSAGTTVELEGWDCPVETVVMITEQCLLCGTQRGDVALFDVACRTPKVVVRAAHGSGFIGDGTGLECAALQIDGRLSSTPNAIVSSSVLAGTDLAVTGGIDGSVVAWCVVPPTRESQGKLTPLRRWSVNGMVNGLALVETTKGVYVIAVTAKEPRTGRWMSRRSFTNGVEVVCLTGGSSSDLLGPVGDCPSFYFVQPNDPAKTSADSKITLSFTDTGDSLFKEMPDGSWVPVEAAADEEHEEQRAAPTSKKGQAQRRQLRPRRGRKSK